MAGTLDLFHRYFLQDPQGKKVELQKGVVRTNCIDCLDRTNVTQVGKFSRRKAQVPKFSELQVEWMLRCLKTVYSRTYYVPYF